MTLLKHPPIPKPKPKPTLSLFNHDKRIRILERALAYLRRALRDERENPAIGFLRTVGALWGIGAFLIVLASLLLAR